MDNITLNWKLIPSWEALDSNKEFMENNGGIYLKIWKPTNEIIYIGEAGCFADRFKQHKKLHFNGGYTTCDYAIMEKENIQSIYEFWRKHMYNKTPSQFIQEENGGHYPEKTKYNSTELEILNKSKYFANNLSFALAVLPNPPYDETKRKEIESYLQIKIWKKTSLALGFDENSFKEQCKIIASKSSSPFGKIEKNYIFNYCPFEVFHQGNDEIEKQFS